MKLKKYWTYNINDEKTWKYIDCIVDKKDGVAYVKRWILNPNFAYKHKDPQRELEKEF